MYRNRLFVAAAAACLFFLAGCQKEQNGVVTLGTKIEKIGGDTKIYLNDNDVPQFFTSGESIRVNGGEYTIESDYKVQDVTAVGRGNYYYAIYPATIVHKTVTDLSTSWDNVTATTAIRLPRYQKYETEAVGSVTKQKINLPCGASLAAGGDNVLRFYNLCSLIEVQYTNPTTESHTITSVEVTAYEKGLWGDGTAQLNGNQSKITIPYNGKNSRVILNIPSGITVAGGAVSPKMYVIVPPYEGGTTFEVKIRFDEGKKSVMKTYTNQVLLRNSIYELTSNSTPEEDNEISGYYSVSSNLKVVFSKGNLQHRGAVNNVSATTWHFADNQYDYYGRKCFNNMNGYNEGNILSTTVDLFAFSISNEATGTGTASPHSYGVRAPLASGGSGTISITSPVDNYAYNNRQSFLDWGGLAINGDVANTWFTLTADEWRYLLDTRVDGHGPELRANVIINNISGHPGLDGNGNAITSVRGFLFFPDDWTRDDLDGLVLSHALQTGSSVVNELSVADLRQLETVGAMFLPAAGYRTVDDDQGKYTELSDTYKVGYYWTSTMLTGAKSSYYIEYKASSTSYVRAIDTKDGTWDCGHSVRLVKPAPGYTDSRSIVNQSTTND